MNAEGGGYPAVGEGTSGCRHGTVCVLRPEGSSGEGASTGRERWWAALEGGGDDVVPTSRKHGGSHCLSENEFEAPFTPREAGDAVSTVGQSMSGVEKEKT
jgi:hypothetical protein